MAEWVGIGRANDGAGHFYANPRSIETDDNNVLRVWTLTDFEKSQKVSSKIKPFKSYLLRLEVNCKAGKSRYMSFMVYSENMGKGVVVLSNDNEFAWSSIPQDSIVNLFANYACKKMLSKQEADAAKKPSSAAHQH